MTPAWWTSLMTRAGSSSRNTPTVRISGGRRRVMSNTCCGATWRGDGAKTKPSASAPIATANSASSSLVMPQIFTNMLVERYSSVASGTSGWFSEPASWLRQRSRPIAERGRRTSRASRRPGSRRSRRRAAARASSPPRTPDSATFTTPSGITPAMRTRPLVVDLERGEVALVDADHRRPGRARRRRARLRRGSRRARRARARSPARAGRRARHGSSAAAISSTQSAPISRASATSSGDTVKSLRSTGSEHASRAACRSAGEPPKNSSSVSTDRHAAPPCSYVLRQQQPGRASGLRSPFDGDRRLISLITASPSAPASARRKPAVAGIVRGLRDAGRRAIACRPRRARGDARGSDRGTWPSGRLSLRTRAARTPCRRRRRSGPAPARSCRGRGS